MKSSTIFLVLGIIIVSVGLAWIVSGGLGAPAQKDVPQTTTPAVVPSTPAQVTADITKTTMAIPETTAPVTDYSHGGTNGYNRPGKTHGDPCISG